MISGTYVPKINKDNKDINVIASATLPSVKVQQMVQDYNQKTQGDSINIRYDSPFREGASLSDTELFMSPRTFVK